LKRKILCLLQIGTIEVPIHTELVSKPNHIPNLSIVDLVPKQLVELVCVCAINLAIPHDTIKQQLPKTFFHPKVRETIIDEILVQE
jgi:hypothetical protein